jgi:hypothetical protein
MSMMNLASTILKEGKEKKRIQKKVMVALVMKKVMVALVGVKHGIMDLDHQRYHLLLPQWS